MTLLETAELFQKHTGHFDLYFFMPHGDFPLFFRCPPSPVWRPRWGLGLGCGMAEWLYRIALLLGIVV